MNIQQQLKAIDCYKQQISWANETEMKEVEWGDITTLILISSHIIHLPTHWTIFESVSLNPYLWSYAYEYKCPPMLLIYGEPPKEEVERIWRQAMYVKVEVENPAFYLYTEFIDAPARIQESRLIASVLDGLDIARTFEKFSREKSAIMKPVWEWE